MNHISNQRITKIAYVLQHSRKIACGCNEVKFIGVYSSNSEAASTIKKLASQPGFRDYPDGFHIDGYEINKDHWQEGFVVFT